jgi:two-component system nitrogen regulation response regulator GlnG
MNAVWIVDDDRSIRWVLEEGDGARRNSVSIVLQRSGSGRGARAIGTAGGRQRHPDAGRLRSQLLSEIKAHHPQIPVIVMTAYSDLDSAVASFQGGAFEYLPKPFDVDQALALIRRASQAANASPFADARRRRIEHRDARQAAAYAGCVSRDRKACRRPARPFPH